MAKPVTTVKSIRVDLAKWSAFKALAEKRGTTPGALVTRLIDEALRETPPTPLTPPAPATKTVQPRVQLHVGPVELPPGSRLKKAKTK